MSFVRPGYPAGGSAGYLTASASPVRHSPAAKFESRSIPDRVISCFSRRGTCVTGYLQ